MASLVADADNPIQARLLIDTNGHAEFEVVLGEDLMCRALLHAVSLLILRSRYSGAGCIASPGAHGGVDGCGVRQCVYGRRRFDRVPG